MKKKNVLTAATLVFTVTVFALLLAMLFPVLFPKTNNVYDRLYYEVKRGGKGTVLLTGTESAYADYDMGIFMHISIPDLNVSLSISGKSLNLHLYDIIDPKSGAYLRDVHFRYDTKDKTLYGENSLDFLNEYFLSHYFGWCSDAGETNKFSLDDPGAFTFILQEMVSWDPH